MLQSVLDFGHDMPCDAEKESERTKTSREAGIECHLPYPRCLTHNGYWGQEAVCLCREEKSITACRILWSRYRSRRGVPGWLPDSHNRAMVGF